MSISCAVLACRGGSGTSSGGVPSAPQIDVSSELSGDPPTSERSASPDRQPVVESSRVTSQPNVALVELFTSEGCSSCPPADRLLRELVTEAQRDELPVVALSFHVDYWDYLGWKDPFSRHDSSARQRWYSRLAGQSGVYTPQMIVDGRHAFVGSSERRARAAIRSALRGVKDASLHIEVQGSNPWRVAYEVTSGPQEGVLQLAFAQRTATTEVAAGENSGETLQHANVVRDFASTRFEESTRGTWSVRTTGTDGTADDGWLIVGVVQSHQTGSVHAVASWSTP